MRKFVFFLLLCVMMALAADKSVYDYTLNSIEGQPAPLRLQGKSPDGGQRRQPMRLHAAVFGA